MSLQHLGWNSFFEAQWHAAVREGQAPGRVVSQQRKLWRVADDFGETWAEPSGKMRLLSKAHGEWPAVGDWVAMEVLESQERGIILGVLQRRSQFVRKEAGRSGRPQVVAANIDTALLVTALDDNFNLRRIERYLAQCWESGASPVVVLNKADICADVAGRVKQVKQVALGTAVVALSAFTRAGIDRLEPFLLPGSTLVVLGSSGVGKSTLINALAGAPIQSVQPIREKDGRGLHTTTARQLILLPSGAMVIDTPGLRELHLWDADDGLAKAFADIVALAAQCRFRDCRHETEPGCAVRAALAAQVLGESRLESLRKLEREQEFLRRKLEPAVRSKEKARIRQIMRDYRQRKKIKAGCEEEG